MADPHAFQGKRLFPFIAPPSGGKGTQTAALLKTYPDRLGKVDMGATFREVVKDPDNPSGQKIREAMEKGELVPITIVIEVFEHALKDAARQSPRAESFILDGFPRNLEQLDNLLVLCQREGPTLPAAFSLNVPEQVIIDRSAGRVFCNHCGEPFNLRIAGMQIHACAVAKRDIGQADRQDYYQREDDEEATVRERLASFQAETRPMIERFRAMGILVELDGNRKLEAVTRDLLTRMETCLGGVPL